MKSLVINTKVANELLIEDEFIALRTFLSTNRYSNTKAEDLSEVF